MYRLIIAGSALAAFTAVANAQTASPDAGTMGTPPTAAAPRSTLPPAPTTTTEQPAPSPDTSAAPPASTDTNTTETDTRAKKKHKPH